MASSPPRAAERTETRGPRDAPQIGDHQDLELVREVELSSRVTMPLLDVVLERFIAASPDFADQDLAAIYELGGPAKDLS